MEEELVTSRRRASVAAVLSASALLLAIVPSTFAQESAAPAGPPPKVVGAFATKIDGTLGRRHQQRPGGRRGRAGKIDYSYQDDIGYDGQMEPVLRGCVADGAAVIFGDAFGNGEAVRTVAAEYPDVAFVFGSDGGPADPNLSVFDNWIHEPAYLAGMLAGGLTKSNIIGVVGAMPIPEVNRLVNAYIAGAQSANPDGRGQGQLHQQLRSTRRPPRRPPSPRSAPAPTCSTPSVTASSRPRRRRASWPSAT